MAHTPAKILQQTYFNRPTLKVARSLMGKYLMRQTEQGVMAGLIVEVEAYVGQEDRACHASRSRTQRTDVLFGAPGIAYVYLIYGMYHCLNVVTEREGFPAAVLIRAVEHRGSPSALIDGPGRVCRSFQIDRTLNRSDLTLGERLWLEDRGERITDADVITAPRIGVDYAGEWAARPWRFRLARFTRQPRQKEKVKR
ncbi:MAG: DNA-3-methyladenine glycosylase [Nitrospirales bacterium]